MPRSASRGRTQLICILADDSASMAGARAEAATHGIREMIAECKKREGTRGFPLYKFLLITFSGTAYVDKQCDMAATSSIELERVKVLGGGGATNITDALRVTIKRLVPYIGKLQVHPEIASHPLPLVLLFSDGEHNGDEPPQPVAAEIKGMELDGDNVVIATVGVGLQKGSEAEKTLQAIATDGCYLSATDAEGLRRFLAAIGGLELTGPADIKRIMALPTPKPKSV